MHIVHVTPYYAPAYAFGGVVRAVEGLATAQAAGGARVTVLTTDALTPTERYGGPLESDEGGVRVMRVPNALYPLRRLNLSTPWGMRRAAASLLRSADVVHVHELRTAEALLVAPQAGRRGVPVVVSPHGTLPYDTGRSAVKRAWDALLTPGVLRHVAALVGLNAHEADEARQFAARWGYDARPSGEASRRRGVRVEVIPNGVDAEAFAALPGEAEFRALSNVGTAPVVLFLGRLHARKGVDVLVRAFSTLRHNARLVIAGPDEGMAALLRPLVAADRRMMLAGFLDGNARLAALAAADIFVLPATGEGASMAALEAMAAGIPLLLSPGCYMPEAEAAGAALIVEPQVGPLAAALARLLDDAALRERMGGAARRLARERYAWGSVADAWQRLYAAL